MVAIPSLGNEVEKQEEVERRLYNWTDEFLDWVWERGPLGKVALLLWVLVIIAPPIFNGYAIYFLWFRLYPTVLVLTERLAVFSILVALANAEALWLNNVLLQGMVTAYATRRRRRKKAHA